MKSAVPLLLPMLLAACAGQPAEHHEYLLPLPAIEVRERGGEPIRLLPVSIAPYLDQQGIVLQTAGPEVHVGRQNRWAEPLDAAVDRYLQTAITNATGRVVEVSPLTTGDAKTEVQVRVHQLHGSADGSVRLTAEWSVATPAGDRLLRVFEASEAQTTDGYPGLVDAHAALLDRLASAIAESLDGV